MEKHLTKKKLQILKHLAKSGRANRYEIQRGTKIAYPLVCDYTKEFLLKEFIEEAERKSFGKKGPKISYRLTLKGLVFLVGHSYKGKFLKLGEGEPSESFIQLNDIELMESIKNYQVLVPTIFKVAKELFENENEDSFYYETLRDVCFWFFISQKNQFEVPFSVYADWVVKDFLEEELKEMFQGRAHKRIPEREKLRYIEYQKQQFSKLFTERFLAHHIEKQKGVSEKWLKIIKNNPTLSILLKDHIEKERKYHQETFQRLTDIIKML